MNENKLIPKIIKELDAASQAQADGKLGMARVCARRAAGWAIQVKLNEQGIILNTRSAFDYIKYYSAQENLEQRISKILEYLQIKVIKDSEDEDSYWPLPGIDLISEAHWLVEKLLGLTIE